MLFRTDRNNNPTAFTTGIAEDALLVKGKDYEVGDAFPPPSLLLPPGFWATQSKLQFA